MDKTYVIKGKPQGEWILLDAKDQNLGRLAAKIAYLLMGKNNPAYTPGVDMGQNVVVINARHLAVAQERLDTKSYHKHSNYPGGLKTVGMREQLNNRPDRVIRAAVWGMLPHNKIGRKLIKRLRVYAESEHVHQAQNPKLVA